jgi:DNA ligase-1
MAGRIAGRQTGGHRNVRGDEMVDRRTCCAWGACLAWRPAAAMPSPPWPGVALAEEAPADIDPSRYLVSEKLDGVRAVWDGLRLRHRSGHPIAAPAWFTAGWPSEALDGELWLARGRFDALSGIVRRRRADDAAWRLVSYEVFDLPGQPGPFASRARRLAETAHRLALPQVRALAQRRVASRGDLQAWLAAVVRQGGEGLVLHRADALWRPGRQATLLKLKPFQDAEAVVIGHEAGHGRLAGRLGALRVRDPQGRVFRLGSGLDDAERAAPPPLGAVVTYRFRGRTPQGLPRFASYLRLRSAP